VSASVNLPLHHKVQKFSSGTGSPGWSRKKGCKTGVCVCYSSREPLGISVTEFLSAGCPSCHPAHSVYALNEIQRYKALATTSGVASSFLHPLPESEERGTGPFTSTLWSPYHFEQSHNHIVIYYYYYYYYYYYICLMAFFTGQPR